MMKLSYHTAKAHSTFFIIDLKYIQKLWFLSDTKFFSWYSILGCRKLRHRNFLKISHCTQVEDNFLISKIRDYLLVPRRLGIFFVEVSPIFFYHQFKHSILSNLPILWVLYALQIDSRVYYVFSNDDDILIS